MPETIYLSDYRPPAFLVAHVDLDFQLEPEQTIVTSSVRYRRNPDASADAPLKLDGRDLELISIRLDGMQLTDDAFLLDACSLTIPETPDSFELTITTRINPAANTALEGLYRSGGNYCTQCEAHGFRRITFYQDRPDLLAPFSVRIEADRATNPILLSNGNPVTTGALDDGRHWACWHDPHPKPCYLFALVAGDLASVEDHYTTISGRDVTLRIFTEAHHIDQCDHAMASLKRAMRWDEERFGLEYDLDLFMLVAVDDFNMGAMENKGLNIFNSRLVFASPETATDADYIAIEAVIGHEYFHNWTGNRVTCRDWFQLSLKEGLTVFRDQEFTADLHSRALKRIEDVRMLRTHQFAEDAGPMAHPIRPASFIEINNFYTVTVYEKGAEVIRLYQRLLGRDGFRRGIDLYFKRHDGEAVTTEDFLAAMADANDVDLTLMQRWYDQAGTPKLAVRLDYDAEQQICRLHCSQSCPPTPESATKLPFPIPLTLGLLLPDGSAAPLQLAGEETPGARERTLLITASEQSFTFTGLPEQPLPSLLRGFSAPVELDYPYTRHDDAFLMAHDSDDFNRWAAAQRLGKGEMLAILGGAEADPTITDAYAAILGDTALDPAVKAEALRLPSESELIEAVAAADPGQIRSVRESLRRFIATTLRDPLQQQYNRLCTVSGTDDAAMQARKLKQICLAYLGCLADRDAIALAKQQFDNASNMSDQFAALSVLSQIDCPERTAALAAFGSQWQHESGVMDKWFSVQATSLLPDTLDRVQQLMAHPQFSLRNPNKVRALLGSFATGNAAAFHSADGSGYRFIADRVLELDALNPQIAARMVRALINWRQIESGRSNLMHEQLQRIAGHSALSNDVAEIVGKSLRSV